MKYLILLVFIAFFGLSSCSPKLKLLGTWKVRGINSFMTQEMVMTKDGQLKMTYSGVEYTSQWMYDDDLKTFVVLLGDIEKEQPQSMVYKVEWKDAKRLKFSNARESFELNKGKELILDQAALKAILVGNWKLKTLNGEESILFTMNLKEDGVAEKIEGGREQKGTWELSEDGKTFSLRDGDGMETMQLVVKDKNTINLVDRHNGVFVFTKKVKSKNIQKLAKQLTGKWKSTKGDITLIFAANGNLEILDDEKTKEEGKWRISEDGNYLILSSEANGEGNLPFEFVNKNTLEVTDVKIEQFIRQ